METPNIESRVKAIIHEVLKTDPSRIMPTSRIREDLGAQSLDLIVLMMALEQEFKGSISDEEAGKLSTIHDVISFIETKFNSEQVSS